MVAVATWAGAVSGTYFYVLKKMNRFRVGLIYEITGMDMLLHGGNEFLSADTIKDIEKKQRGSTRKQPAFRVEPVNSTQGGLT